MTTRPQVRRYRAGQVPDYAREEPKSQPAPSAAPKEDRRLKRLASAVPSDADPVAKRRRHEDEDEEEPDRRPVRAEIVEAASDALPHAPAHTPAYTPPPTRAHESPDIEDADQRRERIRQRLLEEEDEELPVMEDESESSEDESEASEDSDELFVPHRATAIRPVFVKRDARETIAEAEQAAAAEESAHQALESERQAVKHESAVTLLKQTIDLELAAESQQADDDEELMEEEDELDETQLQLEYELWRIRELKRIKRDKEQREAHEHEKREVERRRAMSDAQVMHENALDPEKNKPKKKIKFLQKYYHKGAYYSDELKHLLPTHDFTAPTGEDAMYSKDMMPKVMQVKNYGKASRSKWTHLVNEDTSLLDKERRDFDTNQRIKQKLTGTAPVFERPSKKKKYDQ